MGAAFLKESERQRRLAVGRALRQALEREPRVEAAWLHGSFLAEPDYGDIDMAVLIGDDGTPSARAIEEIEARLQDARPAGDDRVDLKSFAAAPLAFRARVIQAGERLLARDPLAVGRLEDETLSEWFDYLPAWEAYHRALVKDLRSRG